MLHSFLVSLRQSSPPHVPSQLQRQKCLATETEHVAVSSVSMTPKNCATCMEKTHWNPNTGRYWTHCLRHSNKGRDFSDMECSMQNCRNPRGDHNTAAHKRFGPGTNNYRSNPPAPRQGRPPGNRSNTGNTSRGGSKSPQKYSRNNSQNREAVRKSKEGSGTAAVPAPSVVMANTAAVREPS